MIMNLQPEVYLRFLKECECLMLVFMRIIIQSDFHPTSGEMHKTFRNSDWLNRDPHKVYRTSNSCVHFHLRFYQIKMLLY